MLHMRRDDCSRRATRRASGLRLGASLGAEEGHAGRHECLARARATATPPPHGTTDRGSLMMKKQVSASGRTLSPSPADDGKTFMSWSVVYSDSRGSRSLPQLHTRTPQTTDLSISRACIAIFLSPGSFANAKGQQGCKTSHGSTSDSVAHPSTGTWRIQTSSQIL